MSTLDPGMKIGIEAMLISKGIPKERIARGFAEFEGKAVAAEHPSTPPPHLVTIPQAAKALQCTPRSIQRYIHDGLLDVVRKGRLVRVVEASIYKSIGQQVGKEKEE